MKRFFLLCFPLFVHAMDYDVFFENDYVSIAKFIMAPDEEVGYHRDECPHIVIAINCEGVLRRLNPDGSQEDVLFPKGEAILRPEDPYFEGHRTVNLSNEILEAYLIKIKK